ncbi:hypothetical protein [Chondromyces apiculatus]|uniref:Uncharacterized protein n=1 Tax=Chondromyces apiculatus DSM 436 TaxID=1192034 RepID=A0A017TFV8_9BACT|nr:hypothetical protein [Chondromyces apiculatus]EYF08099.1 Hypothetical protein CAP_5859 [Chondromyces apiculatus DSM 436]
MHENGCAGLQAYLDDADENLWFKLRMTLEWDETSFRRMVQALVDCLEATEGAELVPRTLAWIFVSAVPRILALMSRPDFTARNAGEHSPADVSAYFARRKEVLHSLSLWFTDGKALVPDERLSVGDWSPALRRTREGG